MLGTVAYFIIRKTSVLILVVERHNSEDTSAQKLFVLFSLLDRIFRSGRNHTGYSTVLEALASFASTNLWEESL